MEKNKRRFIFSVFVQDLIAKPLAKILIRFGVAANYVTLLGLILALFSGFAYLHQSYLVGSFLFFAALVLDSTDGRVARGTNTFSNFGAKLDAVADKIRSFFVAFLFLLGLGLDYTNTFLLFGFYITLPIVRFLFSLKNKNFYDPTILFWDATPFRHWFVKHGVLGFYTGWERSVAALLFAPLVSSKIEVFVTAVLLEQALFIIGLCFFKKSKIDIEI
jgi:phosphatidylserine synthase